MMWLNRFKSALYNTVGVEDGSGLAFPDNINNSNQIGLPHSLSATRSQREKIQYGRPTFLQLTSPDEVSVTADHAVRPIICPRSFLPWHAGYAETVNAGKSKHNEDQSSVHAGYLTRSVRASPPTADAYRARAGGQMVPSDTCKAEPPRSGNDLANSNVQVNGASLTNCVDPASATTAVPSLQGSQNPNESNKGSPPSSDIASIDGSIVKPPIDASSPTALSEDSSIETDQVSSLKPVDEANHPLAASSSPSDLEDGLILQPNSANITTEEEELCRAVPKVELKDDILTITHDINRPVAVCGDQESSGTTHEIGNQSTMLNNSVCQMSLPDVADSNDRVDASNTDNPLGESDSTSTNVAKNNTNDNSPPSSPYFCPPVSEDRLFVDEGNGSISVSLPYYYFSVFDGHAGWGAALYASQNLHQILHNCLVRVVDYIIPDGKTEGGPAWMQQSIPDPSSVVVGALEHAFHLMDKKIEQDRHRLGISGGCTACIALFIMGKLYVANAGDSRATLCLHKTPYPMSFDFTPETENYRVRKLGSQHPELLGGEYNPIEFIRRPLRREVGSNALCRYPYMAKGWVYKRITEDDLKCPLVCGTGKRSRVMATIGVTRGFGDHDLKAQCTNILIKPFLSSEPEVRILDLEEGSLSDTDVLILGTDGLWDITTNEKAVSTLLDSMARSVHHLPSSDPNRHKYRYTSAAQDMVMSARGKLLQHNWRTNDNKHATIDDIAVFVVPLKPYQDEYKRWKSKLQEVALHYTVKNTLIPKVVADKYLGRSAVVDKNVAIKTTSDGIKNASVGTVEKPLLKTEELTGENTKPAANSTTTTSSAPLGDGITLESS